MRVESNHRSEAQNLVYLPLYDTSITLTQELKLLISRKLVGSLLLTVGRKEVWKNVKYLRSTSIVLREEDSNLRGLRASL